jgi:arylsulfatase A-like enzyme
VMFAGAGLKTAAVSRPITPYDIAPTLASFLGVKPPSGALGIPLTEVVDTNGCPAGGGPP